LSKKPLPFRVGVVHEMSRLKYMESQAFYTLAVEEGVEIGVAKGREEMVEAFLQDGLSIERVAQVSKLSIEKVREIAQRLQL
jgi:predicted transposase YdaD